MKKGRIVAALLCASIGLTAGAAFAQPVPGGPEHGHDMYDLHGHPGQAPEYGLQGGPGRGPVMDDHHAPRPPEHAHEAPRHGDWHRGDRLSADYRDHRYVVDDWHGRGLQEPPRGYQWVGVGGDFLLVAAASGIIAQIVLSH
ncbi:RcnB family protein [Caballeronia insecticola]|uniref:Putative membrane protein n=1 Tax=Caballeronia insecticola TaxID=758793 RepID=R4X1K9_9BURK|nr:RcnB family protein [Caballeronia insecticola]BAN26201.1 putative membrane protein [Caballeronia insecticola]